MTVTERARAALKAKHDEPLDFWLKLVRDLLAESAALEKRLSDGSQP